MKLLRKYFNKFIFRKIGDLKYFSTRRIVKADCVIVFRADSHEFIDHSELLSKYEIAEDLKNERSEKDKEDN